MSFSIVGALLNFSLENQHRSCGTIT